jgi:flavin reductase (DIM6/NTAB) family NADH-FMN oxidoreductase RutF
MPVNPDSFRQALGRFATGVTVVTSRYKNEVHGTTMNAFCSVSLNPPLALVSVNKVADSHDLIDSGGVFAVNILAENQEQLSVTLSQKGTTELDAAHRLEGVKYTISKTGAPILYGIHAFLDCKVINTINAGDHTIYIGQIEDTGWEANTLPLLYHRGKYGRIKPS